VIPRQKNAPKLSPLQWIEKEENISKGRIEKEAAKVGYLKLKDVIASKSFSILYQK
jgi:hypothetical protein